MRNWGESTLPKATKTTTEAAHAAVRRAAVAGPAEEEQPHADEGEPLDDRLRRGERIR